MPKPLVDLFNTHSAVIQNLKNRSESPKNRLRKKFKIIVTDGTIQLDGSVAATKKNYKMQKTKIRKLIFKHQKSKQLRKKHPKKMKIIPCTIQSGGFQEVLFPKKR